MFRLLRLKKWVVLAAALLIPLSCAVTIHFASAQQTEAAAGEDYIRWVDFTPTYAAMRAALDMDMATVEKEVHLNWIELLAYLGTRYGGDFSRYRYSNLCDIRKKLETGATMEELMQDNKYYQYYLDVYTAVLGKMVGNYQWVHEDDSGKEIVETGYGLIAFSPIARGFGYSHYDDFGSARSYGYRRNHLGNDLMASVGTPVVAVESGTVEAIGWNQYGGWRIGIRSMDGLRYYYYAHMQKGHPYVKGLEEGSHVEAGDVTGYVGMTGYSTREDTNGMNVPHLHFGIQLIFDESQKEGNNEIWIDCYNIVELLSSRRSSVAATEEGEYARKYPFAPIE